MSQRLVTIIDTDINLATHLQSELSRYGLTAEIVVDANDLMTRKDGFPELVVLCIDPKRTGWAVCNRLRKSPMLKSIPLIITSAEATEKDFDDHKKLKTRAEEYLHKPFTVESLVDKIAAFIEMPEAGAIPEQLGEQAMDSAEIDIESESSDIEVEPEEIGDAVEYADEMTMGTNRPARGGFEQAGEDESTRIGFASEIDGEVDLETNAAFAAIGLDDPAEQTLSRPVPATSPFDDDPFGLPDPPAIEPPQRMRAPTPPPPVSPAQGYGAVPQMRRDAPADLDSVPVEKIDPEELELDAVARDAAQIVAETPPHLPPALASNYDTSALDEARRENDRLQKEIEELRQKAAAAPAAATQFSREREFLTLRETINKKEKEVLDLKDALDSKDRQILDGKDKLRDAERKAREGEERSLATERELVAAREKLEAVSVDKERGVEREKQVKGRLEDTQKALARAEEEIEQWRGKHAADTASLDEKLNQTVSKYREEMGQLRQNQAESLAELKTEHTRTFASQKAEHEALVAAMRADHGAQQEAQAAEHEAKTQALRAEHAATLSQQIEDHRAALETELKAAERRQGEAIVDLESRHEAAMQEAVGRHKEALRAQTDEAHRTLEQAMADHLAERTRLEADHARAIEMLDARKAEELAQAAQEREEALAQQAETAATVRAQALAELAAEHETAMKAAREQHGRKLQALEESHDDLKAGMQARHATQVSDLRAQHQQAVDEWNAAIAERDALIGQHRDRSTELEAALGTEQAQTQTHARRIEELEDELAGTKTTLEGRVQTLASRDARIAELEQESARYQDQILRAYQRIKSDESTVARAKKALAIALTLLEESEPSNDEAVS